MQQRTLATKKSLPTIVVLHIVFQTHVALVGGKTSNGDGTAHARAFIEGDRNPQPSKVRVAQSNARPGTLRLAINANLIIRMGKTSQPKVEGDDSRDERAGGRRKNFGAGLGAASVAFCPMYRKEAPAYQEGKRCSLARSVALVPFNFLSV